MHLAVQALDCGNPVVIHKQLPLARRDTKFAGFRVAISGCR
jgi:hypothetical protein